MSKTAVTRTGQYRAVIADLAARVETFAHQPIPLRGGRPDPQRVDAAAGHLAAVRRAHAALATTVPVLNE